MTDLRYAARTLRSSRGFTATAVLTLGLGIGGSTAIFSLASTILFGDLPFEDPERLVMVWDDASYQGFPRNDLTPANFEAVRTESRVFDEVAAITQTAFTLTGDGEPTKVEGRRVTASFFRALGVAPQIGRVFGEDEDRPDGARTAVLTHRFWTRRFGGDASVVGREILLSGEKYTVFGVMPRSFQFMESYVGLFVPAAFTPDELTHSSHYLTVLARLAPGATRAQAQADVAAIAERFVSRTPQQPFRAFILPLREQLLGNVRRPLLLLVLAVASVLMIMCANLAGLLLSRAASREKEIAVRIALGATRGRVVRQLLTESVLLGVLGAVPGALVASWGLDALQSLVPEALVLSVEPRLDGRTLAMTIGLAVLSGVLFGLAPALQAGRANLDATLRQGGRGSKGSGQKRLRGALVVGQLGATLVLLVGALLLGQTLYRMRYADLGLRPHGVLTLRTALMPERYAEPSRRAAFYEAVLARVKALPGVVAAGYTTSVPLEWKGASSSILPEGAVRADASYDANHRQVSTDYLATMGIPLRRGRPFSPVDDARSMPVAIVNEAMARQFWPGEEAVGKRFKLLGAGGGGWRPWTTIVGIVGDVRQMGLDAPARAEMYLPHAQITDHPWFAPRDLAVRVAGEPMGLARAIKAVIHEVDPGQAVANVRLFDEILDEEVAARRMGTTLLSAFASLALFLASLGIYGVISYFVVQSTSEFGVRLALGATRRDILVLVLGRGARLALGGLALGLAGSLALARIVSSQLYGVAATDPGTLGAAASTIGAMAVLASFLPALRAIRVDPAAAMRCE